MELKIHEKEVEIKAKEAEIKAKEVENKGKELDILLIKTQSDADNQKSLYDMLFALIKRKYLRNE